MSHEPTSADRIGAGLNLCQYHDHVVAASVRVLAAQLDHAEPAELRELRHERDTRRADLNRFVASTRAAFDQKPSSSTLHTPPMSVGRGK